MTESSRPSNVRRLGEDLLGAEIVVGKELTEAAGSFWEVLEHLGRLQQQQIRYLLEDHGDYWRTVLTSPNPLRGPIELVSLAERRVRHVTEGLRDVASLIDQACAADTPARRTWSALGEVVGRDLRRDGTSESR